MKPEATTELKERLFAQYYSQKVMADKQMPDKTFIVDPQDAKRERSYLKLRSIDSITHEEGDESFSIVDGILFEINLDPLYGNEGNEFEYPPREGVADCETSEITEFIDYLRSRGFALPFGGHSVEELVSLGWVKLSE